MVVIEDHAYIGIRKVVIKQGAMSLVIGRSWDWYGAVAQKVFPLV